MSEYTAIAVPVYEDRSGAVDPGSLEAQAQPCLEVEAPATLPEGYTFEAQFNGHTFAVTVPAGGVKAGQKFIVPHPAVADGLSDFAPRSTVPVGHWKDSLFDCCRFGCCHPVCCNAYCCPLILLGQIMTRLKLTSLASEGTLAQTKRTFHTMMILTVVWIVIRVILSTIQNSTTPLNENGQPSKVYMTSIGIGQILSLVFLVFLVFLASRTRRRIRQKYRIPEGGCGGCDDCCMSFWCPCCTISQMARHTTDYTTYAGQCCSETGVSPNAPALDALPPPASSIV